MLILAGLAIGIALALILEPTISPDEARLVAVAALAAVEASLGGVRAHLERTFSDRVFVATLTTNGLAGVGLVWMGDQLGVDLVTAVAVVLGFRIFQDLAGIRRRVMGR